MIYLIIFFALNCIGLFAAAESGQGWPTVCPPIKLRSAWGSKTPTGIEYALTPLKYVIIHHTATDECETEKECITTVQGIQNYHMDELDYYDIGYNFIFGGDGNIYEGVGWHKVGAHTRGYNSKSIGLGFIGNFGDHLPNEKMLEALKQFLECSVELGELDKNYKLFGGRQFFATESPGRIFYDQLKQWAHYSSSIE